MRRITRAIALWVGQRRVDRVNKWPELRWMCFDIDPHGELPERGAAHRADRSDERSDKALFERRLFAVVLRDSEKVARLRGAGERHKIDLIAAKRVDQPLQRRRVLWQGPAIGHNFDYFRAFAFERGL